VKDLTFSGVSFLWFAVSLKSFVWLLCAAPELLAQDDDDDDHEDNEDPYTEAIDVYSFGIILYVIMVSSFSGSSAH
jgi:hypothetical protein